MIEIRKNWKKLPIGERVTLMGKVIARQEKTPKTLANDDPKLPEFKANYLSVKADDDRLAELEDEMKAIRKSRIAKMDIAENSMGQNASFVEATADNEAQVVEIGYEPAKTSPTPSQPMTAVTDLAVTPGDNDGELDWTLHPVAGSSGYEGRSTTDPNDATKWKTHQIVKRSSGTLNGLPSGVRHYVQFRAIGPLGPGPWSDLAWRMVP